MNDKNLMSPKQQVGHGEVQGSALGGQEQMLPTRLPQALAQMRYMLDVETWQAVLKERALLLIQEEMLERSIAREGAAGLSVAAGAKEQAERESVRQQVERRLAGLGCEQVKEQQPDSVYTLVGETETQRFYKAEARREDVLASEMDQALEAVSSANKSLEDTVSALERRLVRLLRPEPKGKAPNACPMLTPLPMEIMAGAACMQDQVDRLVSILDRLVL